MNILHIIPGDNFTEGMTYKDNFLSHFNAKHGHNVLILSSCATWKNSKIEYQLPCDIIMENGVRLVRLEYKKIFNNYVTKKLRILKNVDQAIEDFQPEVIRVLNPHNFTLPIIARYKREHPSVKLYIDSHQDYFNSGIGFLSYWVFHKILVGRMLRKELRNIDKVFYCQEGVKIFLKEMYKIPEENMEFFPLGGVIMEEEQRISAKNRIRKELGIGDNEIMMVHSGKMSAGKRTKEILEALQELKSGMLKLVIIGSIPDDMEAILKPLIEADKRVLYLGWKSGNELIEYLCAADLYLQPGTASVTVTQALCCGTAVVVAPDIKGYDIYLRGTGWYGKNKEDLKLIFEQILKKPTLLKDMGKIALIIAREKLDYEVLASRLYQ
jgi:glycosyltransferase involved in cell wall biosynthesis